MNTETNPNNFKAIAFFVLTSTIGLILGLVSSETKFFVKGIEADLAATINGSEIYKVDYERAVSLFEKGRRDRASLKDRQMILGRLIDEELLFQYAIDRDFLRRDMNARRTILQAVIGGLEVGDEALDQNHSKYKLIIFQDYLTKLRETATIYLDEN